MPEGQKPYCLAMVLCDAVHRDPGSGKFTLLGTFSRVLAPSFPVRSVFTVYFAVTDGVGTFPLGLRIVDSRSLIDGDESLNEGLPAIDGEMTCADPLATVEHVMAIQMDFPRSGVYHCELHSGEETLMSRRVIVDSAPNATSHSADEGE